MSSLTPGCFESWQQPDLGKQPSSGEGTPHSSEKTTVAAPEVPLCACRHSSVQIAMRWPVQHSRAWPMTSAASCTFLCTEIRCDPHNLSTLTGKSARPLLFPPAALMQHVNCCSVYLWQGFLGASTCSAAVLHSCPCASLRAEKQGKQATCLQKCPTVREGYTQTAECRTCKISYSASIGCESFLRPFRTTIQALAGLCDLLTMHA